MKERYTYRKPKEEPNPEMDFGQDEQQENNARKRRIGREIFEWVRALLIALAVTLFITQVLIVNAHIPSPSMVPTIQPGDRVLGLRTAYWFSSPQQGDIVIFWFPDNETELYVKRVIGMPGDKVEVRDGLVYLNDSPQPLEESYLPEPATGDFGPYQVPEGHYFVMGDNRNLSWDSRYWDNTFVAEDKVVGRAVLRLFPNPGMLE